MKHLARVIPGILIALALLTAGCFTPAVPATPTQSPSATATEQPNTPVPTTLSPTLPATPFSQSYLPWPARSSGEIRLQ
jgi:hypothetical protein